MKEVGLRRDEEERIAAAVEAKRSRDEKGLLKKERSQGRKTESKFTQEQELKGRVSLSLTAGFRAARIGMPCGHADLEGN